MTRAAALLLLISMACYGITVSGTDYDSANFLAPAGTVANGVNLDGVVKLLLNGGSTECSGALVGGGLYVLTAAHCLAGTNPGSTTIYFDTAVAGAFSLTAAQYIINPAWSGTIGNGVDLGLVKLGQHAPAAVPWYTIYTGKSELGAVLQLAGYGRKGTGTTGGINEPFAARQRRYGLNRYDATGADVGLGSAYVLGDFDNGATTNDAFAYLGYPNADADIAGMEVDIASGDSGGPTFLNGQIVGVHSFTASNGVVYGDINSALDSSYGEFFGDTRVSLYADWIGSYHNPEPGSLLLAAPALVLLARKLCARKMRSPIS